MRFCDFLRSEHDPVSRFDQTQFFSGIVSASLIRCHHQFAGSIIYLVCRVFNSLRHNLFSFQTQGICAGSRSTRDAPVSQLRQDMPRRTCGSTANSHAHPDARTADIPHSTGTTRTSSLSPVHTVQQSAFPFLLSSSDSASSRVRNTFLPKSSNLP